MIATFMINPEKEVCLAQFSGHINVAQLRFIEGGLCIIDGQDGSEEIFTDEIHQDVMSALKEEEKILIAHIDDEGQLLKEYEADITRL
jgi:hypothetical protein